MTCARMMILLSLLPTLVLPLNNQDLDLILTVVSQEAWSRLSFACSVTGVQVELIFNQLGDKTIGFPGKPGHGQSVILCIGDYITRNDLVQIINSCITKHNCLLVGSREDIEFVQGIVDFRIHHRTYFLDSKCGILEEAFIVRDLMVSRAVAKFDQENGQSKLKWLHNKHLETRRASFHGSNLRGVVGITPPQVSVVPQFYPVAKWYKDKNGALVASVPKKFVYGIYADMLAVLEKDLNFTTRYTWRRDNKSGIPIVKNGTFVKWGGMIGDTLSGDYDMIVRAMPTTLERVHIVDHLQAMGSVTLAVFVSRSAGSEQRALLTYLMPFRPELWLLLLMNCLLIVVFLKFIHWLLLELPISVAFSSINFVKDYWIVFFSYFGGNGACSGVWWSFSTTKRALLMICLSGCLTNMAYRSSLTSELSVRNHILPFSTPKGFYDSKFQ